MESTISTSDTLPQGTRIGRTALRVANLDELTEFDREVVGLDVLRRADTTSVLGVDETPLLVLEDDEGALERHRSSAGLYHNAFRVPSREALGDALGRIQDRWQLGGASDHWVSEALYLTDPEGNGNEIETNKDHDVRFTILNRPWADLTTAPMPPSRTRVNVLEFDADDWAISRRRGFVDGGIGLGNRDRKLRSVGVTIPHGIS